MPRGQYERKKKTNSAIAYEVEQNKEKTELVENLYEQIQTLDYRLQHQDREIARLNETIKRYMCELLDCYRKLVPHD